VVNVDEIDTQLIRCLQDDPRTSYRSISKRTGISETTVRRRIEGLYGSGTITLNVAPNIHQLGYKSSAIVGLKVDLTQQQAIADEIKAFPEVTFAAVTLGGFDIVFIVAQKSLDALNEFMVQNVSVLEGVKDVNVMVMPELLKILSDWRLPEDTLLSGMNGETGGNDAD
jgi:DNA-binding Lrp family transcriptional regulator